MAKIELTVNGVKHQDDVEPRLLLVHYLRDVLGLTGTNVGCDTSQCGACTVWLNGMAVKACNVLAVQASGGEVMTVEGLKQNGQYHPLQQAFWDNHGLQCGYCTSGMLMTAADLLKNNPHPTEVEVRHSLEGNLCRCTGYHNIVKSILAAADQMSAAGGAEVPTAVAAAMSTAGTVPADAVAEAEMTTAEPREESTAAVAGMPTGNVRPSSAQTVAPSGE